MIKCYIGWIVKRSYTPRKTWYPFDSLKCLLPKSRLKLFVEWMPIARKELGSYLCNLYLNNKQATSNC
ncbi:hypothetical protein ABKV19_014036 [Rosa sericea]